MATVTSVGTGAGAPLTVTATAEHQRKTLAYARLVISRNVLQDLSLLRVTLIALAYIRDPTALNASGKSLFVVLETQ